MKSTEANTFGDTLVSIIKGLISKANFDKTETAIILEVKAGNFYKIKFNNIVYDNIRTLSGNTFTVNETVKVLIPQNNYNQMFILGKLG